MHLIHFLDGLFHRHLKHICSQPNAEVDHYLTASLFQIQFSFFLSLLGFFSVSVRLFFFHLRLFDNIAAPWA